MTILIKLVNISFQIIDDDININDLKTTEESEILVDLLDAEGPAVVYDVVIPEKPKIDIKNKWIKLDYSEYDESIDSENREEQEGKSLFKKRGGNKNYL